MAQVLTFEDFTPPPRYDDLPWTQVKVEEAATAAGTFSVIDTLDIDPVDADPTQPATRSFTTELASDTDALWYQLVFVDASGDVSQATVPIQNVAPRIPYASVEELAAILKVDAAKRRQALRRVLAAAADEIDAEIGVLVPYMAPFPALAVEVNLERAVEHWKQMEAPWGIVGLGGVEGPVYTAKDTWERHANKLSPLKISWGLA